MSTIFQTQYQTEDMLLEKKDKRQFYTNGALQKNGKTDLKLIKIQLYTEIYALSKQGALRQDDLFFFFFEEEAVKEKSFRIKGIQVITEWWIADTKKADR